MADNAPTRREQHRGSTAEPVGWNELESIFDAVFGQHWHGLPRYPDVVGGVTVKWTDEAGFEHQASELSELQTAYESRTAAQITFHGTAESGLYCDFEYFPGPPRPRGILAVQGVAALVDPVVQLIQQLLPYPFEGSVVFLSWGGTRSKRVAEVVQQLLLSLAPSAEIFLSSTSIDPGDDPMRKVLEDGLLRANVLIAVLTEEAAQRPWVIWETASAWARQQLVIPVFVDVRPDDVPGPLASKVQGVHLAERREMDRALQVVSARLGVADVQPISDDQFAELVAAAR